MKFTMKDVYPSGTPFYTINSTPNFDERPQFRMVLLKRNLGKLKRIWDVFFDKWWKKKGIIYSKIDDWPREITFIVTVRKCLVEVFANNEYSGLRQVAHIVVKSSWSCFSLLWYLSRQKIWTHRLMLRSQHE